MRVEIEKRLFTVEEYHRLAEAGVLAPEDRVELIEGEIVKMSPIGQRHMVCVDRATDLFTSALRKRALVSVQNPLRLNTHNEPQPDIVVLKRRDDYYAAKPHTPEDTLLVLEVSDSSLRFDLRVKVPLYAATGVCEVWIENLRENVLVVCRKPAAGSYADQFTLQREESVAPLAFPDVTFKVRDLLG